MRAGKYDFTISQGAVFRLSLTWQDENGDPINLTGYSAKMQIRKGASRKSPLLYELSTDNGGITITPADGKLELFISALDTEDFKFQQAFYDLELNPGNPTETMRLIEGSVSLIGEVTDENES